ncbi:MAG: efflux transporter outer membrane subunit [Opitutales bacterium]|nr:efflux transporter outer membrane subunit [Opitutales bacterium]
MNKFLKIISFLPLIVLSACMVGPDFEKPEYMLDRKFNALQMSGELKQNPQNLSAKDLAEWWKLFGDDDLTWLIEEALKSNFDLETARARVEQARATLAIRKSGFWPSADLNASTRVGSSPIDTDPSDSFGAGAGISWEIDIFGGIRRSIEASEQDYKAAFADSVATRIKIIADVAQAYFQYRAYQIELRITRDNLKTQRKTYDITKQRKVNGFVSQLDVVQAAAEVSSTNAQLPKIEMNERLSLHALELLVGVPTGSLRARLAKEKPLPKLESFIPAGVPADLIERRPDIMMAEHKIHSAVASVGEAEADFYPKFSITGTISYDAPRVGNMFSNQYGSWSVGPTATWNIFQAGKTVANVKLKEAVVKEAKISWQAKVFTAVKEVEDALVSAAKERERIELINTLVEDNQKAFDLSKTLYSAGEIEFLDLLVSQRALLNSQQNQVASRVLFVNHIVNLYKSLGGGF